MEQVWFTTGSSRGFGRALVGAALDAGDRVVATARQPGQLADIAERYGDSVLPVALDVTDSGAVHAAVATGTAQFGGLAWENVSRSADCAEPYPAQYPADAEYT
jgi:NAD(P)-dependent dehydrogenase (short-subunit alcohol dehydrogenase family)